MMDDREKRIIDHFLHYLKRFLDQVGSFIYDVRKDLGLDDKED